MLLSQARRLKGRAAAIEKTTGPLAPLSVHKGLGERRHFCGVVGIVVELKSMHLPIGCCMKHIITSENSGHDILCYAFFLDSGVNIPERGNKIILLNQLFQDFEQPLRILSNSCVEFTEDRLKCIGLLEARFREQSRKHRYTYWPCQNTVGFFMSDQLDQRAVSELVVFDLRDKSAEFIIAKSGRVRPDWCSRHDRGLQLPFLSALDICNTFSCLLSKETYKMNGRRRLDMTMSTTRLGLGSLVLRSAGRSEIRSNPNRIILHADLTL